MFRKTHEAEIAEYAAGLKRANEARDNWRDSSKEWEAKFKLAATDLAKQVEEIAKLTDERDEALAGPWPKWAADLLAIIREYTGPCPEDGWEGVDLPEEMRVWLEGYRDEMQRTGNVAPVPQSEWEALKADAQKWRNSLKRSRDRKAAKNRGGGK
ncbi:hypothetical protein [Sphingopyxis sp. C-1]|uniref:hypothetical protein n=1 Tax=Sphingopyxis sp. C-1 TaxID=262667 RepID=UPI0006C6DD6A|nr:hypothetical protein [Sphingopyxis sp. C-1]GAO78685.1 hypothetical protein SC1_01994 [Sphingopyxis sp. C-1]